MDGTGDGIGARESRTCIHTHPYSLYLLAFHPPTHLNKHTYIHTNIIYPHIPYPSARPLGRAGTRGRPPPGARARRSQRPGRRRPVACFGLGVWCVCWGVCVCATRGDDIMEDPSQSLRSSPPPPPPPHTCLGSQNARRVSSVAAAGAARRRSRRYMPRAGQRSMSVRRKWEVRTCVCIGIVGWLWGG